MPISSSPAAALEPLNHGSRFVWRAVGFLVAACLVVLGARYLILDEHNFDEYVEGLCQAPIIRRFPARVG